ncbi:hypothetical protein, partial [Pseudomonas aeruginosa]|uniref:hypothetical protein n=1 Tax=Pseudomonas aeruginosa TaxID=287 RepID=UPI00287E18AC
QAAKRASCLALLLTFEQAEEVLFESFVTCFCQAKVNILPTVNQIGRERFEVNSRDQSLIGAESVFRGHGVISI